MLRPTRATEPRTFALALLVLILGGSAGSASAVDLATLQGHARGRRVLVEGDLAGAQGAWDVVLANRRGGLHAISLERTCDRAELAAALGRRRGLSPVWVAGGDCATLLWGAFESAAEAETQLAALPAGVLPAGARVVKLSPPLAGLDVDAPPPGPVARVARAEPKPEPVKPRVTPPTEPEVVETAASAPARVQPPVAEVRPDPVPAREPEPRRSVPEPREVIPEPVPAAPEPVPAAPEPVPVRAAVDERPEAAPERQTAPPERPTAAPERRAPEPAPAQPEPVPQEQPVRQRRVPETAPPLPTEPEGLDDAQREERRARASAFFAEGNALWAGGDYVSAIAAFETALELDPNNPRILNNLGTAWLKAERPERAVSVLARAVELDPLYSRAFLNLSTALYAAEQPGEALVSLQRVIDLEPGNLDARYNEAAVLAELRRWGDARAALLEGLEIAPGDPRLMEFLKQIDQQVAVRGSAEPQGSAPARSVDACQGLASDVLRARRAGELFGAGEAATADRDWAAAEAAYLGVLDCDPTSSPAANRLGVARLRRGDSAGASQAFELATRLDPEHLEARANGCLAAYASEDCEAATSCLKGLTADAPSFGPGWRELALMLYRCGRSIEAESAAVRGLESSPDDGRLRGLLARIQGERVAAPR